MSSPDTAVDTSALPLGLVDRPTSVDSLGMLPYADALTDFIMGCPTPMTIAVQGDWGSGKTSTLAMIQDRLQQRPDEVDLVDFNTWQYSQFDLGEDLVSHLLQSIVRQISPRGGSEELSRVGRYLAVLKGAGAGAVRAGARAADAAVGAAVGHVAGDIGQAAYEGAKDGYVDAWRGGAPAEDDVVTALVGLRESFRTIVRDRTVPAGGERASRRVVVMIDDLDRLPPKRSIEVMEGLKTLLDCPGCVFVLAIDFDVVQQGVRDKYGPAMDATKARAYFDKMIQLPFQMPTQRFTVDGLLRGSLEELGIVTDDLEILGELVACSVGTNPRALKRLLNTFSLLRRIAGPGSPDPRADAQLFAFLALQVGFPDFHEVAAATAPESLRGLLRTAREVAGRDDEEARSSHAAWGVSGRPQQLAHFLTAMLGALPGDDDPAGRRTMAQGMGLTRITAVRSQRSTPVRLERATVMDLSERTSRLQAQDLDAAAIRHAEGLETQVRERLAREGLPFSAAEQAKGNAWSWYASTEERQGPRRGTFCEVYFARGGTLNLYFGPGSWPEELLASLGADAAEVARRNGWQFQRGKSGNVLRLYGVTSDAPLDALLDLLMRCYRQVRGE